MFILIPTKPQLHNVRSVCGNTMDVSGFINTIARHQAA